jgi:lysophospholipase L1-like esterase
MALPLVSGDLNGERIPMREHRENRRVLILGDSWLRGLGPERRKASGRLIAEAFGASVLLDLSAISRTATDFARDYLDQIADFKPEVAILSIGGADSLIFPAWPIQRFIDRYAPPHWHGVEGLVRPVAYPRSRLRRVRQQIEVTVKLCFKQVVVNAFGGRRRVSLGDLEVAVRAILAHLTALGTPMVVLGYCAVDGWSSPKSTKSLWKTNALLARICEDFSAATYVPTASMVDCWGDYLADHVHMNASGHQHVADGVIKALLQEGEPWASLLTRHRAVDDPKGADLIG